MANLIRVQATFEHVSGLPKDRVSNNFWFAIPGPANDAAAADVIGRVRDFYVQVIAPRTRNVIQALSPAIADVGHTLKAYDYDEVTGERLSYQDAPPIRTEAFAAISSYGTRDNSEPMPSEVACCLSYKSVSGAVLGGGNFATPVAQRRGRVAIGPLTVNVSAPVAGTIARPTAGFIDELLVAGEFLALPSETNPWVVYSRPFAGRTAITAEARANAGGPARPLPALPARDGQAYIIDQVSVDDAWDTQRRRGEAALARTITNV